MHTLILITTLLAAGLWYAAPQVGAWPLAPVLAAWAAHFARERRWPRPGARDLLLLLFAATALISVWTAFDQETAWSKLWVIAGGLLLYYAAHTSAPVPPASPPAPRASASAPRTSAFLSADAAAGWLLGLFGAGVALYFVATHAWGAYAAKMGLLAEIGARLQGLLPPPPAGLPLHRLHPNVVGGILALTAPFAAAAAWTALRGGRGARRWLPALLALAALGLTLLGLLLSVSRGAWLALAGAAGLALLWGAAGLLSRGRPQRRRWWALGGLLAALLAVLLAALLAPALPAGALTKLPGLDGGLGRLDLYRNSLILALDYPYLGAGLGGFMMLYSTYAFLIHVGYIIHAHNLYLNVAIEQGGLALLALLGLWALFGAEVWRRAENGRLPPMLLAAALALTTIALHGLVEDALYGSRAVILLFIPLAFAGAGARARAGAPAPARRRPRPLFLLVVAAAAALLLLGWRPLASYGWSNWGAVQQSRAELSVYSWPERKIQDLVRREIDLSGAMAAYERALALYPANAAANRRLGQIELSLGQYDAARAHLEAAYTAAPWDNATRQLYGEALIVTGEKARGAALWETVNNAQGQLTVREFWYGAIGEGERLAR